MDKPEFSFRPYTSTDEAACLKLFESNTPKFFGVKERSSFERFLKRQPCPFFVVEFEEIIIACGGYCKEDEKIVLAWGMVRNDLHRQGVGTFLLQERLKAIFRDNPAAKVIIDTSQHSQSFFARFGFKAIRLIPDYYASDIHRVDMELELTDNLRRMVADDISP
jgi:N-acetylglutamate synthase-like GNAT family acetyltransferase